MAMVTSIGTRLRAVPFDTAIEAYLERIKARGCTANTVRAYAADLADLQGFLATHGISVVGLLSDRYMERWLDDLAQRPNKVTLRTAARKLTVVRQFVAHAIREAWITHDPTKDCRVRFRARRIIAPDMAALMGMVKAIHVAGEASTQALLNIRDRALLRLALDAGMRITETIQLDAPDCEPKPAHTVDRLMVYVLGKGGGTEGVCIDDTTRRYVDEWIRVRHRMAATNERALFVSTRGTRLTRQALHYMIQRRGAVVGLTHIHWHMLRHRRIGEIYEAVGVEAAQIHARHAHRSTTENVYGAHAQRTIHKRIREGAPLPAEATP